MTVFFCFELIILGIVAYYGTNKSFASPAVVTVFSFLCSAVACLCYEDYWQLSLSAVVILYISSAIVALLAGAILSSWTVESFIQKKNTRYLNYRFVADNYFIGIYFIIACISVYQFYDLLFSAIDVSRLESTEYLVKSRELMLNGMIEQSPVLKFGLSIVNCAAYVSIYYLIYNTHYFGFSRNEIKFIIPIIVFLVLTTIKAARIDLLQVFLYGSTIYVLLNELDNKKGYTIKIIKGIAAGGSVFLLIFLLLRFLRGGEFDPFIHLAKYIGGGMLCFGLYFEGFDSPFTQNGVWGIHTFSAIYNSLRLIGFDIPVLPVPMGGETFVTHGYDFDCNVFSALSNYHEDFGVLGSLIIFFIIGLMYSVFHRYIQKRAIKGLILMMYADSLTGVFLLPVAEQIFNEHIISFSRIAHFVLLFVFYRCMVSHSKSVK